MLGVSEHKPKPSNLLTKLKLRQAGQAHRTSLADNAIPAGQAWSKLSCLEVDLLNGEIRVFTTTLQLPLCNESPTAI
jgi:hypothetical protein